MENIFGKIDRFVLGDFGHAKQVGVLEGSHWKKTYDAKRTVMVGSRYTKAPEILIKDKYSQKIDLYSAMLVFYEMLTGLPAFYIPPSDKLTSEQADNFLYNYIK